MGQGKEEASYVAPDVETPAHMWRRLCVSVITFLRSLFSYALKLLKLTLSLRLSILISVKDCKFVINLHGTIHFYI